MLKTARCVDFCSDEKSSQSALLMELSPMSNNTQPSPKDSGVDVNSPLRRDEDVIFGSPLVSQNNISLTSSNNSNGLFETSRDVKVFSYNTVTFSSPSNASSSGATTSGSDRLTSELKNSSKAATSRTTKFYSGDRKKHFDINQFQAKEFRKIIMSDPKGKKKKSSIGKTSSSKSLLSQSSSFQSLLSPKTPSEDATKNYAVSPIKERKVGIVIKVTKPILLDSKKRKNCAEKSEVTAKKLFVVLDSVTTNGNCSKDVSADRSLNMSPTMPELHRETPFHDVKSKNIKAGPRGSKNLRRKATKTDVLAACARRSNLRSASLAAAPPVIDNLSAESSPLFAAVRKSEECSPICLPKRITCKLGDNIIVKTLLPDDKNCSRSKAKSKSSENESSFLQVKSVSGLKIKLTKPKTKGEEFSISKSAEIEDDPLNRDASFSTTVTQSNFVSLLPASNSGFLSASNVIITNPRINSDVVWDAKKCDKNASSDFAVKTLTTPVQGTSVSGAGNEGAFRREECQGRMKIKVTQEKEVVMPDGKKKILKLRMFVPSPESSPRGDTCESRRENNVLRDSTTFATLPVAVPVFSSQGYSSPKLNVDVIVSACNGMKPTAFVDQNLYVDNLSGKTEANTNLDHQGHTYSLSHVFDSSKTISQDCLNVPVLDSCKIVSDASLIDCSTKDDTLSAYSSHLNPSHSFNPSYSSPPNTGIKIDSHEASFDCSKFCNTFRPIDLSFDWSSSRLNSDHFTKVYGPGQSGSSSELVPSLMPVQCKHEEDEKAKLNESPSEKICSATCCTTLLSSADLHHHRHQRDSPKAISIYGNTPKCNSTSVPAVSSSTFSNDLCLNSRNEENSGAIHKQICISKQPLLKTDCANNVKLTTCYANNHTTFQTESRVNVSRDATESSSMVPNEEGLIKPLMSCPKELQKHDSICKNSIVIDKPVDRTLISAMPALEKITTVEPVEKENLEVAGKKRTFKFDGLELQYDDSAEIGCNIQRRLRKRSKDIDQEENKVTKEDKPESKRKRNGSAAISKKQKSAANKSSNLSNSLIFSTFTNQCPVNLTSPMMHGSSFVNGFVLPGALPPSPFKIQSNSLSVSLPPPSAQPDNSLSVSCCPKDNPVHSPTCNDKEFISEIRGPELESSRLPTNFSLFSPNHSAFALSKNKDLLFTSAVTSSPLLSPSHFSISRSCFKSPAVSSCIENVFSETLLNGCIVGSGSLPTSSICSLPTNVLFSLADSKMNNSLSSERSLSPSVTSHSVIKNDSSADSSIQCTTFPEKEELLCTISNEIPPSPPPPPPKFVRSFKEVDTSSTVEAPANQLSEKSPAPVLTDSVDSPLPDKLLSSQTPSFSQSCDIYSNQSEFLGQNILAHPPVSSGYVACSRDNKSALFQEKSKRLHRISQRLQANSAIPLKSSDIPNKVISEEIPCLNTTPNLIDNESKKAEVEKQKAKEEEEAKKKAEDDLKKYYLHHKDEIIRYVLHQTQLVKLRNKAYRLFCCLFPEVQMPLRLSPDSRAIDQLIETTISVLEKSHIVDDALAAPKISKDERCTSSNDIEWKDKNNCSVNNVPSKNSFNSPENKTLTNNAEKSALNCDVTLCRDPESCLLRLQISMRQLLCLALPHLEPYLSSEASLSIMDKILDRIVLANCAFIGRESGSGSSAVTLNGGDCEIES